MLSMPCLPARTVAVHTLDRPVILMGDDGGVRSTGLQRNDQLITGYRTIDNLPWCFENKSRGGSIAGS